MILEDLKIVINSEGIFISTIKDSEVVFDYQIGNPDIIVNDKLLKELGAKKC